ncbi:MAG TPA: cytochrome c oxidase subunit II [Allosphingosinicella sp.]|jgi:cytochrome c oxidase subunit 2|nr:cytochrome c oxidase subunit II [Allosphingosinicella sp.]
MKTPLKLILAAAAFALAPAAALSQAAPAAAPGQTAQAPAPAAQAPRDSISANSQAAPAQPEEMNQPQGEEPSNASVLASSPARTAPNATVGQPTGALGFQPQVTPIGEEALFFHNTILMPIITVISIFVLALLLYVMIRFRRGANPVPSRTTHNTLLEVVWTLVPVLILVAIAVPSIRLLAHQYAPPKADITVKATGNQWYWTYTYPDHGGFEIVSNGLKDADAKARSEPRLLAVDERMVVPQGATVKMIITAADVIHSWGVPAFWTKLDAVPGRLNETWFRTDKPGVYYGQCFELCGARHAYMPIAVEVLPPAQFAAWVASKGGKMPGPGGTRAPDSTAASPVTNPPAAATGGASGATETSPAPPAVTPGTTTPPTSSQGATNTKRGN